VTQDRAEHVPESHLVQRRSEKTRARPNHLVLLVAQQIDPVAHVPLPVAAMQKPVIPHLVPEMIQLVIRRVLVAGIRRIVRVAEPPWVLGDHLIAIHDFNRLEDAAQRQQHQIQNRRLLRFFSVEMKRRIGRRFGRIWRERHLVGPFSVRSAFRHDLQVFEHLPQIRLMRRLDTHRTKFGDHEIVERHRTCLRRFRIPLRLVLFFHLMEHAVRARGRFHRLRSNCVVPFRIDAPAFDAAAESTRSLEERDCLEWFVCADA
jgi:hypothetical protein